MSGRSAKQYGGRRGTKRDPPALFNVGTARPYQCPVCVSGFDSETEVEIHRTSSHRLAIQKQFSKGFGCTLCVTAFPKEAQLRQHVEKRHLYIQNEKSKLDRPVYVCDACDFVFFDKIGLLIHFYRKHDRVPNEHRVSCPICAKEVRLRTMSAHLDNSHTRSLKTCPVCWQREARAELLPAHVAMEHPPAHRCLHCRLVAETASELEAHLADAHARTGGAAGARALRRPRRYFTALGRAAGKQRAGRVYFAHAGLNLRTMLALCVFCGQLAYSEDDMVQHLKREHGHTYATPRAERLRRRSLRACPHCAQTFSTEVLLKHHVFKLHSEREREAESAAESAADGASAGGACDLLAAWQSDGDDHSAAESGRESGSECESERGAAGAAYRVVAAGARGDADEYEIEIVEGDDS